MIQLTKITESDLPALIREHDYHKPSFPEWTLPYILPQRDPVIRTESPDQSETIGPCPSHFFNYANEKTKPTHRLKSENILEIIAAKIKYR